MPQKKVMERAHRDSQEGKAPSTQAGEFVREEFEHVREGKHGARSPQQAESDMYHPIASNAGYQLRRT